MTEDVSQEAFLAAWQRDLDGGRARAARDRSAAEHDAQRRLEPALAWNGGDTVELATFLPATEWTAKLIHGETMRSARGWTKTAPAGTAIVVKLTDARGIRITIQSSHMRRLKRLVIVRMPSTARTRLTLAEPDERTKAQGMPSIQSGGGLGLRYLSSGLYVVVVDAGDHMVEAWGDEDDAGELRFLTAASAVVRETFVDVVPE